jgi:hypothetical protein
VTTAGARVRVTASQRSDTVVLVEPVDSTNNTDVKVAENTEVDHSAGELSIRTTKSGGKNGSVAITIELPVGSRLVLNTAWTDLHADGALGDCELNIASGRVRLDRIAALRANLAGGDVAIGHVAGTATIEGGTAGVRIGQAAGAVTYQGSTGKVWIGHAMADIELGGGSGGGFDIDRADGAVTAKAGDCPIRIGRLTRGHADLTNASGGIEVGIDAATAAAVDARSTKGSVRNSLPERDNAENDVRVYARTRLDDIVIHPAVA